MEIPAMQTFRDNNETSKQSGESRENARGELLELLSQAEEDVRNGRGAPVTETFADLRARLREC